MLDPSAVRAKIAAVPHWFHIIEVAPGVFTPGAYDCRVLFNMLDLPRDLSGRRVLDVGARDGYYSFELEKRGADVLAVDYIPANETGFATLKEIFGSKVNYLHANLLDLRPEQGRGRRPARV